MKRSKNMKFISLTDPSQIPDEMTEDEARTFWDTHELTDTFLEKARLEDDNDPPMRQRTPEPSRADSVYSGDNTAERFQTKKVTRK